MARGTSWWIATSEHTVADVVPARPDEVRRFYVDLNNITSLHPLVVSVDPITREDTDDGYVQIYRVRDRIPLGPFKLGIVYTARVQVPVLGDVYTEAKQFPRVRLTGVVSFDGTDGGTRLTERLRIEAPRLLAAVTVQQALAAHTAMLAGIRKRFE